MGLRLNAVAKRPGVIGIAARFNRFIADNAVENADLEIKAIADRSAKSDIGLADGEITGASSSNRLGPKGIGLPAGPEVNGIGSGPFFFAEGVFNAQLDDIEVEAISFGGATKLVIRQVSVARTDVPLSRGIDVPAEGGGRK